MGRKRNSKNLKRRVATRKPIPRILIVTEGAKTEVNYFEEIRIANRQSVQNITVVHSLLGEQPLRVVASALDEFNRRGKAFDHVFAVFDRDDHPDFENAIASCSSKNGKLKNDMGEKVEFLAIGLVPCFEIWPLLHFEDVQATLHRDEVTIRLKEWIPSYEKNISNLFELTQRDLGKATSRAQRLRDKCERKNGDFLHADVDLVIERIMDVVSKSKK